MTSITIIVLIIALIAAHRDGLTRDDSNTVLGGVCSGIAVRYGLAVPLVRVLAVLAAIGTHGLATALYILLWITLPKR
ncbi:MAG: PspC domain-containing protein [Cyanobacteria bacterium REEB67]|nr:PspC domain-containing protein [Cyanobacteria bacterium REEB67]